jgi:DNA invertase Pin-like site-specific DNA recombinase
VRIVGRDDEDIGRGQRPCVFAEFERAMIVERVNTGLARAKAQGKRFGRPTLPAKKRALSPAAAGTGAVKAARLAGVGVSTVQRIKPKIAAAA